ncbi:hypothetical protein AXF42_Ash012461 [Apostasia shenzhenica]|uniref:CREG-like beta-barrel domain-containing protein n=1 Tax=Apostasia shenzhenica TaxID=1088818 RepID=A0A2I0AQU7_9ASPA|nr:hypothetical protein AXF42_Ash012461 [Apostasia shenzhenica]
MRTSSSSPMAVQAAIFILFFLISLLLQSPAAFGIRYAIPPAASPPIPNPSDAAATARWLVAKNSWGVISTISVDLKGAPFGEVVSYSDGEPGHGFGIPYFYLSQLEPTLKDASTDDRAALTLSEVPLGTCRKDPQDPTCAKITLNGKLKWISREDPELKLAQVALFTKHPEMQGNY